MVFQKQFIFIHANLCLQKFTNTDIKKYGLCKKRHYLAILKPPESREKVCAHAGVSLLLSSVGHI